MPFHALIKESPMTIASGTVWPWVTMTCALSDFKVVAHGPEAAGTFGFQGACHCQGLCPLPYVFPAPLHLPRNRKEGKVTCVWLLLCALC